MTKYGQYSVLYETTINPVFKADVLKKSPYIYQPNDYYNAKILLMQPRYLGDIFATTPLIKALKDKYNARIDILCEPPYNWALTANKSLENIYLYSPPRSMKDGREYLDRRSFNEYARSLVSALDLNGYDWVINLSGWAFCAALGSLIKSGKKQGLILEPSGKSMVKGNIWELFNFMLWFDKNMSKYRLINGTETNFRRVNVNPKNRNIIIDSGRHAKHNSSEYIGLIPVAGRAQKLWGLDNFIRLSKILIKKHDKKIIVFMGPADHDIRKKMEAGVKKGISFSCGEGDIVNTARRMTGCSLIITHDTGLMYLASALKIPTLELAGPTLVAPHLNFRHLMLYSDIGCINCGYFSACSVNKCMKNISLKAVLSSALLLEMLGVKSLKDEDVEKAVKGGVFKGLCLFYSDVSTMYSRKYTKMIDLKKYYRPGPPDAGEIVSEICRFLNLNVMNHMDKKSGNQAYNIFTAGEIKGILRKKYNAALNNEIKNRLVSVIDGLKESGIAGPDNFTSGLFYFEYLKYLPGDKNILFAECLAYLIHSIKKFIV